MFILPGFELCIKPTDNSILIISSECLKTFFRAGLLCLSCYGSEEEDFEYFEQFFFCHTTVFAVHIPITVLAQTHHMSDRYTTLAFRLFYYNFS